jgi:hypothetical protein
MSKNDEREAVISTITRHYNPEIKTQAFAHQKFNSIFIRIQLETNKHQRMSGQD